VNMVSTTDAHKAVQILTREARGEEVSAEELRFIERYFAKRERKSQSNGNGSEQ
jgi:hypothetical protein